MADPPLLAGGVNISVALPEPGLALVIPGAPGSPAGGVTETLLLPVPLPDALLATTEQSYATPPISPVTVMEVALGPALAVIVGRPAAVQVAV